jgi:hypothetical protein
MPLYPTSFFVPSSATIPFLMEDTYIRGGWHCVADDAARDALPTGARKAGMRMYVASTGFTWTLVGTNLTAWVRVADGAVRNTFIYTPTVAILAGSSINFTLASGKSAFILKAELTHPSIALECHTTSARNDTNPYKFVSYAGHLVDDGSSVLEDDSQQFNRRFAIVSNLEAVVSVNTYWKIINNNTAAITPTTTIVYLPLEQ